MCFLMPANVGRRYLSVAEAAREFRVSTATIYRAVADGSIPRVRLRRDGAIRIPSSIGGHSSPSAPARTGLSPAVEAGSAHGGENA